MTKKIDRQNHIMPISCFLLICFTVGKFVVVSLGYNLSTAIRRSNSKVILKKFVSSLINLLIYTYIGGACAHFKTGVAQYKVDAKDAGSLPEINYCLCLSSVQ